MHRVSRARTYGLTVLGALLLGACASSATHNGTGGNSSAGTGGNSSAATGGNSSAGTGGSSSGGSGGSSSGGSGSGGSIPAGTGGNGSGGTGGSAPAGTGGNLPAGTGGNSPTGTGGGSSGGAGGSNSAGMAGSGAGGLGGKSPTGTGGSASGGTSGTPSACAVGAVTGAPGFGAPMQQGAGMSTAKYLGADITRDGVGYRFITNWWGQGWTGASVTYSGTGFSVASAAGTSMPDGTPIGYPTTYCGQYSETTAGGNCGLPVAFTAIDSLWTGWKWKSADTGQYNAAWDIWLGTASAFQSYLMVWLRDPPVRVPAGSSTIDNVTVAGVPGTWIIKYGTVNNRPIVNYVRAEGKDACEFEFNVMAFVNDAKARTALTLPGDTVRAIAVGFEFWTGPFTDVASEDFYIKLTKK